MEFSRITPAHRKLIVWQRSMELAVECNRLASRLPAHERYELSSQIRTASVSIYSNVAEGAGRRTRAEFSNFLSMARGSAMEVDSHTEYASRVGYLAADDVKSAQSEANEIIRMLSSMMNNYTPFQRKRGA